MNFYAIRAIYKFEMARTFRTLLQSIVTPVVSTSLYFVVFGAAIGSRITNIDGVSYGSFIVPGLIMLSAHAEHLERIVRHLLPQVHGHDLRDPVRPRLLHRDRHQLRRGGRDQIGHTRSHHPGHRGPVRSAGDSSSPVDDRVPRAHIRELQPLRLPSGHLGRGLREAAARALPHNHAVDLPRRQLLLRRDVAAVLAERSPSSTPSST